MWIVAGAVGLVGESLFPDRTDYRILMAEPLSRLTIFGSKLASLLLFGGLFVAGTHLALLPLAALTMIGAMKTGALVTTAMAFCVLERARKPFRCPGDRCRPRASRAGCAASAADRVLRRGEEFLIGALALSLPLVARLPATAGAFSSNAWWLPWAPPAWFVGLERWLIGDASRAALAAEAAIGTVVVLVVSVASYVSAVPPVRSGDRPVVSFGEQCRPGSFAGQVERPCRQCGAPSAVSWRSRSGGVSCIRAWSSARWPPRGRSC